MFSWPPSAHPHRVIAAVCKGLSMPGCRGCWASGQALGCSCTVLCVPHGLTVHLLHLLACMAAMLLPGWHTSQTTCSACMPAGCACTWPDRCCCGARAIARVWPTYVGNGWQVQRGLPCACVARGPPDTANSWSSTFGSAKQHQGGWLFGVTRPCRSGYLCQPVSGPKLTL